MRFRYRWFRQSLLSFIEIAFVINLIILDVVILGHVPQMPIAAASQQSQTITSPLALPSPLPTSIIPSTSSPTPTVASQITYHYQPPAVKEYFVPFGSGEGNAADWTNVTGLQTYIDSSQYPALKQVVFEASVHIPTGNEWASVRLFNVTDQHPVWFSDVTLSGGKPLLLISSPITLDSGNKLYQVQLKTQLQYPAILDQARIHITLQ